MRGANMSRVAAIALIIGMHVTTSAGQASSPSPAKAVAVNFASEAYQWGQGGIPRGDYQLTCRDITSNGNTVQARCQKRNGDWHTTSLNYRNCHGGIINNDGHLQCGAGGGYGGGGWQGGLPPGDYKETCRNMRVNGSRLDATCQKRDGNWRDTSLSNYNQCRSRIVNDDGHLRCGR